MIVNFDELVAPIFLVKLELQDRHEEIVGADCFNVSFERALTSFLNDKFLLIPCVYISPEEQSSESMGFINSISYDKENIALVLDNKTCQLVWTAEQLGRLVNIEPTGSPHTKISNPYAIYDKPYKTKLYYDKGNGAEPFPNLGIYMYDGLRSDASEIEITDMYDQESKILSIPKVTGKIKIYHAMRS